MLKCCQNGAKTDAKTNQKSMHKQVAENMTKIMSNLAFLRCKIMEIRYTVVKKQGFARLIRGAGKT